MKKVLSFLVPVMAITMAVSCGGGSTSSNSSKQASKSARQASVSLGDLDDYFTVKSYTIESDAEEKGVENIGKVKGTLTLVIKRNDQEMKYKPSDIDYAIFAGISSSLDDFLFSGDCSAVVRKIVKMEPGSEESFSIGFKCDDPYNQYRNEEVNATARQNAFDAITNKGGLDEIHINVEFKREALEALNASYSSSDDDDDDDDDDDIRSLFF